MNKLHDLTHKTIRTGAEGTISDFAEKHRLKIKRDGDGELIIPGDDLSQVYEWNDSQLAVIFATPVSKPARTHFWRKYRDAASAAGMKLLQNGDAEGALAFDASDAAQVRLALKLAGIKRKRKASASQLAALARHRAGSKKSPDTGPSFDLISTISPSLTLNTSAPQNLA